MPSLVQKGSTRPFFILRKLTSIGTDVENDLTLIGQNIAPTHALLKLDGGRFILSSQSRKFPIYVNGRKIKKHTLEHEDVVLIGEHTLRFSLWDEPSHTMESTQPTATDDVAAYTQLAEFCTRLAEIDDMDQLLEAIMDEVIDLTSAGKGFLLLCEADGLVVKTARNLKRETIQKETVEFSDSIVNQVLDTKKPVIVSDALNDTFFCQSRSVLQLKLCSVMCVPMIFGGALIGVLYVGNDNVVSLFENRSLEVLTVFASQAALLLANAIVRDELSDDNARMRQELEGKKYGALVGDCPSMRQVFTRVEKVSTRAVNVLILGETGTGKELIAREIHRRSPRASGPFIPINCGAIPENLIESELFGHRRGAFTGATSDKRGCFQAADGGTLFLDEIGEMPLQVQVKLLRAVQERAITPVGESKPRPIDIRLLTATHVDLEAAIQHGKFREDLYYRINVVNVELPPLRDRGEDVILLARHFASILSTEYERPMQGFTQDGLRAIRRHRWPGNIRELQNRLRKALLFAEGAKLSAADLELNEDAQITEVLPLATAKDAFQERYIDQVLALNGGNRTQTARDLDVDPRTIFRHLEKKRHQT